MQIFDSLGSEYEQISFGHDPTAGLRTIIAVYSTARGPALGGTRMWPYPDEQTAFADALRLGKAMAYKAACADLALGGGKAVIIGDPARDKTPELLRAYAAQINRLGGTYITTADVGTNVHDLDVISSVTRYVTGTTAGSGDPSPNTAWGVFCGIEAVAERVFGSTSLRGKSVIVQGVGKVGSSLARLLAEAGASVSVADLSMEAAASLGFDVISPEIVFSTPCDIVAPCALGPVVTDETISTFKCAAIAGAANNQLATPAHGRLLAEHGIVYAPDYVINAGGLINVEDELHGYDAQRARAKASAIAETLRAVFDIADREKITPGDAADHLAEERITRAAS